MTSYYEKQIERAKECVMLSTMIPLASGRPPLNTFQPFADAELLAFIGILIAAGVHRQNKENLDDMWNGDALTLTRATMSRNRFKKMLRFIRFDNVNTRSERAQTDKAAPIREIWIMLNRTNNYFHLEAMLNLYITYHPNLLNMASRFSGLATHQPRTHCKVRFTLKN